VPYYTPLLIAGTVVAHSKNGQTISGNKNFGDSRLGITSTDYFECLYPDPNFHPCSDTQHFRADRPVCYQVPISTLRDYALPDQFGLHNRQYVRDNLPATLGQENRSKGL